MTAGVRQVAAELRQERRFLRPRRRRLFVQQLDDVLAHAREAHALLVQDRRGDRALFAQEAEQQVLGADVGVQQPVGFFGRELQHALGVRAEGDVDRRRDLLAEDRAAFNLLADAVERQVRARENAARQPFAFANQSEQQMLGLDRRAAHLGRFVAREEQHASRPFGIAFKHQSPGSDRDRRSCGIIRQDVRRSGRDSGWSAGAQPAAFEPQHAIARGRKRRIVRGNDRRQPVLAVHLAQQLVQVRRGVLRRGCRSARRPGAARAGRPARARPPRAAARRRTARRAGAARVGQADALEQRRAPARALGRRRGSGDAQRHLDVLGAVNSGSR